MKNIIKWLLPSIIAIFTFISIGAYLPIARDFFLDVAAGNISNTTHVNKFGGNLVSTAGSTLEVWDGQIAYTFPATATITHIRAAVTSATMTGLIVEVQGLDASWDQVTQNATLDGTDATTEVALSTALIRVFRMKILSNSVTDQNIWIGATGMAANTANAIIQIGNNQTLMAIYTVPNGKTAYITQYYGDVVEDVVAGKDPDKTRFELWVADRDNSYEFQLKSQRGIPKGKSGFMHTFKPYVKVTQKSDIKVTTTCTTRNGDVHAGFDLILVDN